MDTSPHFSQDGSTLEATARPPAIVLGSGITALGVERILGRAGIPLFVASDHTGMEGSSRFHRTLPGAFEERDLAGSLERCPLERGVLIPCSDALTLAVAELPGGLRERFPASVPPSELLGRLVDKTELAALLGRHEVPHPRTAAVRTPADVPAWVEDVDRAFVKPSDSQRFFAHFGVKAFMPSGRGEIAELVDRALGQGFEVVIQEYVPGPPSNHVLIDGFIDRHGVVRALFARRRLRMYPPDFGNSCALVSVSRDEVRPAEHDLVRFLQAVGYRGIFSAEFKQNERDGSFPLLEINTRAWWFVEFAARAGVDVVSLAYADALGRDVASIGDYQVGRRLVFPYFDFGAALEARRRHEGGVLPVLRSWIGADHAVFVSDDPRPFLTEFRRMASGYLGRRARRWSGGPERAAAPGSVR